MFSPNSGVLAGGNYNIDNRGPSGNNSAIWQQYYQNIIRYLVDIQNQIQGDANRTNLYQMTRIWKAYTFMVLTDTTAMYPTRGRAWATSAEM